MNQENNAARIYTSQSVDPEYIRINAVAYIHVDDPCVWSRGKDMQASLQIEKEVWKFIKENFEMKGEYQRLSRENAAEFQSMRMSVTADLTRVQLNNEFKIKQILEKHGMSDCNPRNVPFTREVLEQMHAGKLAGRFLTEEGGTKHREIIGELDSTDNRTYACSIYINCRQVRSATS